MGVLITQHTGKNSSTDPNRTTQNDKRSSKYNSLRLRGIFQNWSYE